MPMRPESEMSWPTFSACSASATTLTVTYGEDSEISSALFPAASTISPCGARMMPVFCTSGATRNTRPPEVVSMMPWLSTAPAPGTSLKRMRPARKSSFVRLRLEATKPATSMRAPWPITTPPGLSRNTRPFDCSMPSMTLCGIAPPEPMTRFSTAFTAEGCRNLVRSLIPIEKLPQLRIALPLVVIVSVGVPSPAMPCTPVTICGLVGLASACWEEIAKQAATETAISFGLRWGFPFPTFFMGPILVPAGGDNRKFSTLGQKLYATAK